MDQAFHDKILEGTGLDQLQNLGTAILELAEWEPARRSLTLEISAQTLRFINTPGAWLLDTIYTMRRVIYGDIVAVHKLSYRVVGNGVLKELLKQCRLGEFMASAHGGDRHYGDSENNRGNQAEHLAWLALEADRCDIIIAMAHHARVIEIQKGWAD